jgi:hypothetical protein
LCRLERDGYGVEKFAASFIDFIKCLDSNMDAAKSDGDSQLLAPEAIDIVRDQCSSSLESNLKNDSDEFSNQYLSMTLEFLEEMAVRPVLNDLSEIKTLKENALVNLQMCKYFENKTNSMLFGTPIEFNEVPNSAEEEGSGIDQELMYGNDPDEFFARGDRIGRNLKSPPGNEQIVIIDSEGLIYDDIQQPTQKFSSFKICDSVMKKLYFQPRIKGINADNKKLPVFASVDEESVSQLQENTIEDIETVLEWAKTRKQYQALKYYDQSVEEIAHAVYELLKNNPTLTSKIAYLENKKGDHEIFKDIMSNLENQNNKWLKRKFKNETPLS